MVEEVNLNLVLMHLSWLIWKTLIIRGYGFDLLESVGCRECKDINELVGTIAF